MTATSTPPGDPRAFAAPRPAAHRVGAVHHTQDGTRITDHWFTVPLDHADPDGRQITVYAREYVASRHTDHPSRADRPAHPARTGSDAADRLPWLLYLQGGPGSRGVRQGQLSGWMKELSGRYRILMLDQRGTGLSTPLTRHSLPAEGGVPEQVAYLVHLRAPQIVQDAEMIRLALGSDPWTTLGQSYGGFCTLSYLSWHPEGLARSLITGGLAPLDGHADRVYQATYRRMHARNEEFFERYPQDRDVLARLVDLARRPAAPVLPDGSPVTVGRLQMLGMYLGGNTRIDQLHYLLQEAFEAPGRLSDTFLTGLLQQVTRAGNPLYTVMHESIYAQPAELTDGRAETGWAAQRVLGEHPDFDPDRTETPLLTGEMVYDWMPRLDPVLQPLAPVTDALARHTAWTPLYDVARLAANEVPVAAAVYRDDVYVDRDLSRQSAQRVSRLEVWETAEYHHDGLAEDGPRIVRRLQEL